MPIPDLILGAGKVLATQTSMDGVEVQTPGYIFGIVDSVNEITDKISVGTYFLFRQEDSIVIKYGSTIYYYLDVNNIKGFTKLTPP